MMMAVYVGPLKEDVKDHLDRYYDKPFGVFERYYELQGAYFIPPEISEHLIGCTQMDWGSWLSICDRDTFRRIFTDAYTVIPIIPLNMKNGGRKPPVRGSKIHGSSDAEWYGVLSAELW